MLEYCACHTRQSRHPSPDWQYPITSLPPIPLCVPISRGHVSFFWVRLPRALSAACVDGGGGVVCVAVCVEERRALVSARKMGSGLRAPAEDLGDGVRLDL